MKCSAITSFIPILAMMLMPSGASAAPLGKWLDNPAEFKQPSEVATSPNGRLAVHISNSIFVLTHGSQTLQISDQALMSGWNGSGAQVLWAPDSKAFSVTWSDGGATGGWHVDIVRIAGSKATMSKIGQAISTDFQKYYSCVIGHEQVPPNLSAIKWANKSKELWIEASVVPVSFCPKMGTSMSYLVTIPQGNIIEKYNAHQTTKRWGKILF